MREVSKRCGSGRDLCVASRALAKLKAGRASE